MTELALTTVEPKEPPVFRVSEDMKADCEQLLSMLTYRRLAGSKTERKFIREFIRPLGVSQDKFGNLYKQIGNNPKVLWSSHTDTVHGTGGFLELGFAGPQVGVSENDYSDCLGADDAAGVWLMCQMIKENRPGLYIFHRQEEGGRNGSKYIAKTCASLLSSVKYAVALDRKEYNSIITHQMGDRCCSEDFSKSIAAELGMDYKSDPTGSFTDTASYVDLIGECTNLSVGYEAAHTRLERLNMPFIFKLRDALLKLNPDNLVEKRKPGEKEKRTYTYTGSYGGRDDYWDGYGGHGYYGKSWWEREKEREEQRKRQRSVVVHSTDRVIENKYDDGRAYGKNDTRDDEYDWDQSSMDIVAMCRMVKDNPEATVDILDQYGISCDELREHILSMHGVVPR